MNFGQQLLTRRQLWATKKISSHQQSQRYLHHLFQKQFMKIRKLQKKLLHLTENYGSACLKLFTVRSYQSQFWEGRRQKLPFTKELVQKITTEYQSVFQNKLGAQVFLHLESDNLNKIYDIYLVVATNQPTTDPAIVVSQPITSEQVIEDDYYSYDYYYEDEKDEGETKSEAETEAKTESNAETESNTETEAKTESNTETEAKTESNTETEAKTEFDAEAEAKTESDAETEAKTEAKTESGDETGTKENQTTNQDEK